MNGQTFIYRFDQTGIFTIEIAGSNPNGGAINRSFRVNVFQASMDASIPAWQGKPRNWICTNLPPEAVLEADPRLALEALADVGQYRVKTDSAEPRHILARLGKNGPVLAQSCVNGFQLYSSLNSNISVINTLEDGTQLIEMGLVLSPLLPAVRIDIELIVGGVVFEDGTVSKSLVFEDWDALGEAAVRFLRPGAARTSVCHKTKAYTGSVLLGEH